MKDFSFLIPVFGQFWREKRDSFDRYDPTQNLEEAKIVNPAFGEENWNKLIGSLNTLLGDSQPERLSEISRLLSKSVFDGRYRFNIEPEVDLIALEWTFVQVDKLGLSGLDLLKSSDSQPNLHRYNLMPYMQCCLCGNLLKPPKRGRQDRVAWCHWEGQNGSGCGSGSGSGEHRKGLKKKKGPHCCYGIFRNRTENLKSAIRKAKSERVAGIKFKALLERLYEENRKISHKLPPIKAEHVDSTCFIALFFMDCSRVKAIDVTSLFKWVLFWMSPNSYPDLSRIEDLAEKALGLGVSTFTRSSPLDSPKF